MSCKRKQLRLVTACMLLTLALAGCGADDGEDVQSGSSAQEEVSIDELFSDRDLAGTYDEAEASSILLADGATESDAAGVTVDGDIITIEKEGIYILSGSLSDGQILIAAGDDKVQLVLDGVNIGCTGSAAIYVKEADKVFLTLKEGTQNTISEAGTFEETEEGIDAAIYSKADLTLNGSGTLTVNCEGGHGIVSKDDLKLTGGDYTIQAAKGGLSGNDSVCVSDGTYQITAGGKGIKSDTAVYLLGGDFTITAEDDTIHSNGFRKITDGVYALASGDDGIHADSDLVIDNGSITISESYEGLEGMTITVNGGEITLKSDDDGLNAAGGNDSSGFGGMKNDMFAADSDCWIIINGGKISVNADGDGIDSNGDLTVTGGEIYVQGPANSADGALDYNGNATITGGTIVALGASGMAQSFGEDSTQGVIMVNFAQSITGTAALFDADGNELVSLETEKSYNSIVVSCPQITEDGSYTVSCGTQSQTVEMSGLLYQSGGMSGGMGMPGGNMKNPGGNMGTPGGNMEKPDGSVDSF